MEQGLEQIHASSPLFVKDGSMEAERTACPGVKSVTLSSLTVEYDSKGCAGTSIATHAAKVSICANKTIM